MKTSKSLFAVAFVVAIPSAMAWVQPGWDRPVFQAQMSVLNEQGQIPSNLSNAKSVELVMTQQDGNPAPQGFVLLIDGQTSQSYQVASSSVDRCGTTTYELAPIQDSTHYVLDHVSQKLEVVDHADNRCMDYHRYRWELDIQNLDLSLQAVGQMRWVGNPESIITQQ